MTATRKVVGTLEIDLGNGPETVKFANVSLLARKNAMVSRLKVTGRNKEGQDLYGIPPSAGVDMQVDGLVESIITDEGKPRFTAKEVLAMDAETFDKLVEYFSDNVGFNGPEKAKEAKIERDQKAADEKAKKESGEDAEGSENP